MENIICQEDHHSNSLTMGKNYESLSLSITLLRNDISTFIPTQIEHK